MYAMLVSLMERAFLLYKAIEKFDAEVAENRKNRKRLVVWH
jgi:hypothetical protein